MGFTLPQTVARCAVRSYRTLSPLPATEVAGGLLSVALAVSLRCPDVIWHPTLWSPDFPRQARGLVAIVRSTQCTVYQTGTKKTQLRGEKGKKVGGCTFLINIMPFEGKQVRLQAILSLCPWLQVCQCP